MSTLAAGAPPAPAADEPDSEAGLGDLPVVAAEEEAPAPPDVAAEVEVLREDDGARVNEGLQALRDIAPAGPRPFSPTLFPSKYSSLLPQCPTFIPLTSRVYPPHLVLARAFAGGPGCPGQARSRGGRG